MKYTTILLDADDTIFDFERSEHNALRSACLDCGVEFTEDCAKAYSKINDALWKALERGEVKREELKYMRFERLCLEMNFPANRKTAERLSEAYITALSQQVIELDGAFSVVKILSKIYGLYIVTNGLLKVQRPRFEKSGLSGFVSGIFISEEVGASKPSKEFFDKVLQKIGVADRRSVLIVGDSLTSDMQGGRNAGIDTCLFDPKGKTEMPNSLCDYKIASLGNLIKH